MIPRSAWAAGLLGWLAFAAASGPGAEDEAWWRHEPPPDGPTLLRRMREAMPEGVVELRGLLLPRGSEARDARRLEAFLQLDWHGVPARAFFEVREPESGEYVAGFLVERRPGEPPAYHRILPDGARAEASPDEPVLDTVFIWRDLAFDYLWWPDAEFVRVEMRRQRRCYLVDIRNPEPGAAETVVRLWVDDATYAPLQAETRDARGRPLRELSVRSLRRIGLQWTVEDLEARDRETGRRTLLRILPPEAP